MHAVLSWLAASLDRVSALSAIIFHAIAWHAHLTGMTRAGGSDATLRLWSTDDAVTGGAASSFKMAHALPTKATPLSAVQFTRRNLVLATGSLVLPSGMGNSSKAGKQSAKR